MKTRRISNLIIGSKLILALLFAFAVANVQAGTKLFELELEVSSDQKTLEIVDSPTKHDCAPGAKKGCLRVNKHDNGDIEFKLKSKVKCGEDNKGTWKLTSVYLGGKNHPDKPLTGTSPVDWGNLDADVEKDFQVANSSTGLLTLRNPGPAQKIRIFDSNQSKSGYFIYYKVVAMCKDGDKDLDGPIVSDPRIENEGNPN